MPAITPARVYTIDDLIDALVAAHRLQLVSGEKREYVVARDNAMRGGFGLASKIDKPGLLPQDRHLEELMNETIKLLAGKLSPFDGMMEAPPPIVALYQKYGKNIRDAENGLRYTIASLCRAVIEQRLVPGKLTVTEENLLAQGFDLKGSEEDPEDI